MRVDHTKLRSLQHNSGSKSLTNSAKSAYSSSPSQAAEPTLRDDLPELLIYAQKKGIVTGLITNGRKLKDPKYVKTLEDAGLDFVQVTLESDKPEIHDEMTKAVGSWAETVEGIKKRC